MFYIQFFENFLMSNLIKNYLTNGIRLYHFRPSMSRGTGLGQERYQERDFVIATPEEFVKKFGGNRVINKVHDLNIKFMSYE